MYLFFFQKETLRSCGHLCSSLICFSHCKMTDNPPPPLCVCRYSPVQRATVSSAWNVISSSMTLFTAAPAAFTVKVHPNLMRLTKATTLVIIIFFFGNSLHCWYTYLYSSFLYHMAGKIKIIKISPLNLLNMQYIWTVVKHQCHLLNIMLSILV